MLIPRSVLSALSRPLTNLVCILHTLTEQNSPGTAGYDFIAVKGKDTDIPEITGLDSPISRPKGFCSIFYNHRPMCICNLPDLTHLPRCSVERCNDNQSDLRIKPECPFQGCRVHIPGIILRINEDGFSAFIGHRIHRGIKGHVAAENLFSFQCAVSDFRLTIEFFPRQLYGKVQGRCAV